jgi:hypothetical protein
MDTNKILLEWSNELRKEGFDTFPITDRDEIVILEITAKSFQASIWKEKGRLYLFVPFPYLVEKEIKDNLESCFFKIAEEKIKKLRLTYNKPVIFDSLIEPKPLLMEHEVIGMRMYVNDVKNVIDLLREFDDIYEKMNPNI